MRELPIRHDGPEAAQPLAIGAHGDELFVAWVDRLTAIDKRSGAARELRGASSRVSWMASDGRRLIAGGPSGFEPLDLSQAFFADDVVPRAMRQRTALPAPLGTFIGDRVLLVTQKSAAGGEAPAVSAALVVPDTIWQSEMLTLKLYLRDGGITYELGPKPMRTVEALTRELRRIAKDPSARVPGVDGKSRLMPVVIEAYPGTRVATMLSAYDAAAGAGFARILCIDSTKSGPWNRGLVEPPPPPPRQQGK